MAKKVLIIDDSRMSRWAAAGRAETQEAHGEGRSGRSHLVAVAVRSLDPRDPAAFPSAMPELATSHAL